MHESQDEIEEQVLHSLWQGLQEFIEVIGSDW
jgi:hypothetical protein